MQTMTCTIERIIHHDSENGFSVLLAKDRDACDELTLVGTFYEVKSGVVLTVYGDWHHDRNYGRQFRVDSWKEELPETITEIEKYLGSGLIQGVGVEIAKSIVSIFGLQTFEVIENDYKKLLEVPRVGIKRAEEIHKAWDTHKDRREVMMFLQSNGVNALYALKIYNQYGKDSIEKIVANVYCLVDDIWGIGFKTADKIAERLGYIKTDSRRCKSGIIYSLKTIIKNGHVYSAYNQLVNTAQSLLQIEEEPICETINQMMNSRDLIIEEDEVFLPIYYNSEVGVANKIKRLISCITNDSECQEFEPYVELTDIDYNESQKEAIKRAVKSKVMVLTGGPGTGKTTTTLGIIKALESIGKRILLTAPTGKAAKCLSETTGREAKTIHRLLEFNGNGVFFRDDKNPLDADALIIDESSMIDIILMNSLLKAVPLHMHLIFIGDIDQLPSVGPGNVLRDIIDSGVVPVVRLLEVFRSAQNSRIITNAHKVNHGLFPDISNGRESNFFFIKQDSPCMVAQEIVNIVKNRIPKAYHFSINDIQVLSPMRDTEAGVTNLNIKLQESINPEGDFVAYGQFKYREKDRVMQIRNNYEKDVFNGNIGFVSNVNKDDRSLTVLFDNKEVVYEEYELDELTLAYAITIHKSQGSEYPVVVIPLLMIHSVMLQRNLLYTGITRAKNLCIIVGTTNALQYSINNIVAQKRNTKLKERLRSH